MCILYGGTMRRYKGFMFKTKPWAHQLAALRYLYKRDSAALYTKPGSGKTKIMIDLIINRGFQRILVVAPKKVCKIWKKQFQIHSEIDPQHIVELYKLDTKSKAALLKTYKKPGENSLDIFVCNYDSVWRPPVDAVWFYKKLGIDCVICDESHRIKSPGSKCSRFLAKLGRLVSHRYLMTGTPLAENPMDVYAQYRFLDPSIFGVRYGDFCERYQNIDPIVTARVGFPILDKKNPYKNLDELREKMFSCAFYMESVVKLPPIKIIDVPVIMPHKVQTLYEGLVKEGAVELLDGFMTVENVLSMTTREQQLTSGYLKLEYDDGSKKLKRISTYRRNALIDLLNKIPKDEPVVVFARLRKDLVSIRAVANRIGCGYSEISGKEDTQKDWEEGKTRILGVQYGAGSEGIDLTKACYCIYYSLSHSLGLYDQSMKRCHRPGQTRPVTYYRMYAVMDKGMTVDEKILYCLKEKKDYVKAVMSGNFNFIKNS